MKLLSKPIRAIKGKTIKDFACQNADLVLTFTDGTWGYFYWDGDELDGPTSYTEPLCLFPDARFKLGLVSREDYNAWRDRTSKAQELQTLYAKERRQREYFRLKKEFEDE